MITALMSEAQLYDGSPQPVPSGRPRHSAPRQLRNEYHSYTGLRADLLELLEGNSGLFESQSPHLREGSFELLPGVGSTAEPACLDLAFAQPGRKSPVVGLETRRPAESRD